MRRMGKFIIGIVATSLLALLGSLLLLGIMQTAQVQARTGCAASSSLATSTPASTPTGAGTPVDLAAACSPGSPYGSAVVAWARRMADALYVNPACGSQRGGTCNDTWYTSAFPQPVIQYGQTWCRTQGGCADWANGSYQCVSFVRGAYSQVYPMTVSNDAFALWGTYQHVPGWQEIPAAATTNVAARGLPQPGDVMVFQSTGVGHVAIVLQVQAPVNGKPGQVQFANANSSSAYDQMPIEPDLTIDTAEWAPSGGHYVVWGYLRPKINASAALTRVNQIDQAPYDSHAEWNTWAYSACSAAAMTEVLDAYGMHLRIHEVLRVESARDDIDPTLGLTHDGGIADTMSQFGFHTQWSEQWTLAQVVAVANSGEPVIVSWPPSLYAGGHIVVVIGGDLTAGTLQIADSSLWNRQTLSVTQFLHWWAGFAAVSTPAA
jgi:hypothetical protein